MLVFPANLSISRSAWLLLSLLTLSVNAMLWWSIIYVAEPKNQPKRIRETAVRLVSLPPEQAPILEERLPSEPSKLSSIEPPNLSLLPANLLNAPDLASHIMVPTKPLDATFSEITPFNPTSLQGLDALRPVLAQPVLEARPLLQIAPLYPSQALARGVEGAVLLEFSVDAQGSPYAIQVVQENPKGYFKQATLKAFARWRFPVDPHLASNTRYQYTVTYKIDK